MTDRRVGANYVPSQGWFHSWLDFRPDDVRRDLSDLAGLGLDHVRIFPIWPWIQPNRGLIRERAINDVLTTIDIAGEFGLGVSVDLLQGHLSSFDFLPSWVLTWHRASVFDSERVREGILRYVRTMTERVTSRDNVFAVTLGNEVNNLWPVNETTPDRSTEWARDLVAAATGAAAGRRVLHSLFDDAFYAPDHPFRPADVTEIGDLSLVHSWVFNGTSRIDGPLGPATVTHADYLVELAAATASTAGRPVWLQEIGVPAPDIPADQSADFVHATVDAVRTSPALWGVTWWCSHDISRDLLDFPEREYDLGLFTVDRVAKPAARALAERVADLRTPATAPRRSIPCDVDLLTEPHRRAEVAPGSEFHRAWVAARASGPTAIVPTARQWTEEELRDRAIAGTRVD